jgi:hypothetical protein
MLIAIIKCLISQKRTFKIVVKDIKTDIIDKKLAKKIRIIGII